MINKGLETTQHLMLLQVHAFQAIIRHLFSFLKLVTDLVV